MAQTPKTQKFTPLEEGEEEKLVKALQKLNELIGIDDSINEVVVKAEDPYGNPYTIVFKWDPKRMAWVYSLTQ